jgi:glutamine amidotransferase
VTVIVDTGGANLASIQNALLRLQQPSQVSDDAEVIRRAARVILPGVGNAAHAMARLRARGLESVLRELRQPVLGICLGLQLYFESSQESDTGAASPIACLGLWPGRVTRLVPTPTLRVPHLGWNRLQARASRLLAGLDAAEAFYFVHSYRIPDGPDVVACTADEQKIPAVFEAGNFLGTQFHPERSGPAGARLLANFLALGTS